MAISNAAAATIGFVGGAALGALPFLSQGKSKEGYPAGALVGVGTLAGSGLFLLGYLLIKDNATQNQLPAGALGIGPTVRPRLRAWASRAFQLLSMNCLTWRTFDGMHKKILADKLVNQGWWIGANGRADLAVMARVMDEYCRGLLY